MTPTYVIGDLQGCFQPLDALLHLVYQASADANIIFLGDIVNRGPQSLETLRLVKKLHDEGKANTVLGNHDFHLLAAAHGIRRLHPTDTLTDILNAPDKEELLDWLRHRPLAIQHDNYLMFHAGVLPQWTTTQALAYAKEVELQLQSDDWIDFLSQVFANTPAKWDDQLTGIDRLRCITNAFTRCRFCEADGSMDFKVKGDPAKAPEHLTPWFELPQRQTQNSTVVFGHWSTLGLTMRDNVISLDTGCLWGGQLTAMRLSDRHVLQIACKQEQVPTIGV